MIRCRVHIKNELEYMDGDVFVEVELPCLPPVGSILWLSNQERKVLERMATKHTNIARRYAPRWFYGDSHSCSNPKEENLKDLSFSDANKVTDILFSKNREFVDIEIQDE